MKGKSDDLFKQILSTLDAPLLACSFSRRAGSRQWTRVDFSCSIEERIRLDKLVRDNAVEVTAFAGIASQKLERQVDFILEVQKKPHDRWTLVAEVQTLLTGRFANWRVSDSTEVESVSHDISETVRRVFMSVIPPIKQDRDLLVFLSSDAKAARQMSSDQIKRLLRCALLSCAVHGATSTEFARSIEKLQLAGEDLATRTLAFCKREGDEIKT